MNTRLSRNSIWSAAASYFSAANAISRALIAPAASFAAMPLMSEPEDAAVADVFGTFAVVVAVIFTFSASTPNSSATTCATLM